MAALLGCVLDWGTTGLDSGAGETGSAALEPGFEGGFQTENSAGRTGSFWVPDGWDRGPLPVLVGYHGTGGEGRQMVNTFAVEAAEYGFAIVAPDSRVSPSGSKTWEVGTESGEITEDVLHTQALLGELENLGVDLDEGRFFGTGFSGGGSSAPYMATNDGRFNAYGVLHGGAFPDGFGDNAVVGWFSTGEDDDARDPDHVQDQADDVTKAGYPEPEVHIYPGGHSISEAERSEVIDWWLAQARVD